LGTTTRMISTFAEFWGGLRGGEGGGGKKKMGGGGENQNRSRDVLQTKHRKSGGPPKGGKPGGESQARVWITQKKKHKTSGDRMTIPTPSRSNCGANSQEVCGGQPYAVGQGGGGGARKTIEKIQTPGEHGGGGRGGDRGAGEATSTGQSKVFHGKVLTRKNIGKRKKQKGVEQDIRVNEPKNAHAHPKSQVNNGWSGKEP